eukprot:1948261-Alexandrium_andersonii.AAC.1
MTTERGNTLCVACAGAARTPYGSTSWASAPGSQTSSLARLSPCPLLERIQKDEQHCELGTSKYPRFSSPPMFVVNEGTRLLR